MSRESKIFESYFYDDVQVLFISCSLELFLGYCIMQEYRKYKNRK